MMSTNLKTLVRRGFMRFTKLTLATAAARVAAGTAQAQAALDTACSVSVTATQNGDVVESYGTDFTVARDVPFFDDFSTPTRQKEFRASVTREPDGIKVHVGYFSDLGTFYAASFDADLLGAQKPRTTSGGTGFFLSTNDTPVGGNHEIRYTLTCER